MTRPIGESVPGRILFACCLVLALTLPLLIAVGSRVLADRVGRAAGATASRWLAGVRSTFPEEPGPRAKAARIADRELSKSSLPVSEAPPAPLDPDGELESMASKHMPRAARFKVPLQRPDPTGVAGARGVRVSAHQVLDLARRRSMPGAMVVGETLLHPAGLSLTGVSTLGIGMRDGDVLTRVGGEPALSVAAVTAAVIRARGALISEIAAEFWRDGERWNVIVEQPYVRPSSTAADPQQRF